MALSNKIILLLFLALPIFVQAQELTLPEYVKVEFKYDLALNSFSARYADRISATANIERRESRFIVSLVHGSGAYLDNSFDYFEIPNNPEYEGILIDGSREKFTPSVVDITALLPVAEPIDMDALVRIEDRNDKTGQQGSYGKIVYEQKYHEIPPNEYIPAHTVCNVGARNYTCGGGGWGFIDYFGLITLICLTLSIPLKVTAIVLEHRHKNHSQVKTLINLTIITGLIGIIGLSILIFWIKLLK